MKLIAIGNIDLYNELSQSISNAEIVHRESADNISGVDGVFLLDGFTTLNLLAKVPVFVNSVAETLAETNAPQHYIRLNGWKSFLQRSTWELAGHINTEAKAILQGLGKEYIVCADEPGFISPRPLAMIINEAFFALGENVSTKKEIDIAMKLGTNYPYGPFEWANIIGEKNILSLLRKLAQKDSKYFPSPELEKICSY